MTTLAGLSDTTYDRLTKAVAAAGADAGKSGGTWVFDGTTPEATVRQTLQWIEDGDPMWEIRSPLSGEYAGDPTVTEIILSAASDIGLDLDEDHEDALLADELALQWLESYTAAFEAEVVRDGKALLDTTEQP